MNTLKITRISEMLTEQHNLEAAKITHTEIDGKEYDIYTPCNLNLYIGPRCNCNCNFCFADRMNAGSDISDEEYLRALDEVLEKIKKVPIEVTITGGEPTLYPERLIEVMKLITEHGIPQRTFSTNGIGLETRIEEKPLMYYMKENGFIHNINLSRMSIDEARNEKIFRGKCITNEKIQRIAAFADLNGMDMRLSCNLIEHEIDSWEEIHKYMEHYKGIGIHSFIFRELMGCKRPIKVAGIVDEMKQKKKVIPLKTMEGFFYVIDIYRLNDMLIKHYRQKAHTSAPMANIVFYNGKLLDGWNGNTIYGGYNDKSWK